MLVKKYSTRPLKTIQAIRLFITFLILCFISIGCAALSEDKNSNIPVIDNIPLVSIIISGGMCDGDNCINDIVFYVHGETIWRRRNINFSTGSLNENEINLLKTEISKTNFEIIKNGVFDDVCPSVNDGATKTFIFHENSGDIVLSDCKFKIDKTYPIFNLLENLTRKYHRGYMLFKSKGE